MRRLLTAILARWRALRGRSRLREALPAGGRGTTAAGMAGGTLPGASVLDCDSVMRQLWDYLDGELTSDRMGAIRAHLDLCRRCYPQYEFEQAFLAAVGGRRRQHSDQQRLRTRVADALRAHGLTDA